MRLFVSPRMAAGLGLALAAGVVFGKPVQADGPLCGANATTEVGTSVNYSFREPYPLDTVIRHRASAKRVRCDMSGLVLHRGRAMRYTVRAHPAFSTRLRRFERVVVRLATEHYGRAPRKLAHRGVFACRNMRGTRTRISEHALGNALDVRGFDFGRLPKGAAKPADMPKRMRRGFKLRVEDHWSPRHRRDAYHARFLHTLMDALRDRPEIFRGVVGPPWPRHHDHLHLDAAPWRYALFEHDD